MRPAAEIVQQREPVGIRGIEVRHALERDQLFHRRDHQREGRIRDRQLTGNSKGRPDDFAQLRGDGRMAVVGGFVSKLGLATGPYACALAIKHYGYPEIIAVSAGLLLVGGLLCLAPALALDRARRVQPVA